MKAPLILIASSKMGNNKKTDRHEDKLIRMGASSRLNLGLSGEKTVELWPSTIDIDDRLFRSKVLSIYEAYSEDLKKLRNSDMSERDYLRVGFVTPRTFSYICRDNKKKKDNIWIADTIEDTVIGADPEFLLMIRDGVYMYASEVQGFGHGDELGSDGPWAELRPKPAVGIDEFVRNIQKLLNAHPNADLIRNYAWLSGCYYYGQRGEAIDDERDWPLGGHIHIGTPSTLTNAMKDDDAYRNAMFSCLYKILDEYIAIPMMRLDGIKNSIKRREEYGHYGDIRTADGRLEYRTLSAEWLDHPILAAAVLGTVKSIAHAYFRSLEENKFDRAAVMPKSMAKDHSGISLYTFFDASFGQWAHIDVVQEFKANTSSHNMRNILNKGHMEFTNNFFDNHKRLLRNISTYREYAEYIDMFLDVIRLSDDDLVSIDRNLKHTWVEEAGFII